MLQCLAAMSPALALAGEPQIDANLAVAPKSTPVARRPGRISRSTLTRADSQLGTVIPLLEGLRTLTPAEVTETMRNAIYTSYREVVRAERSLRAQNAVLHADDISIDAASLKHVEAATESYSGFLRQFAQLQLAVTRLGSVEFNIPAALDAARAARLALELPFADLEQPLRRTHPNEEAL